MTSASIREQVAKQSHEKSKNPNFEKILSLFRDWDFDLPESCKILLYKLTTGACDWLDSRGKLLEQGCIIFEFFEFKKK